MTRRAQGALSIGLIFGLFAACQPATAGNTLNCTVSAALTSLGSPLSRTAGVLAEGKSLTILATGSSSTLGVGASSPLASYPSDLERELRDRFPGC
jgi:acyl-CoA thioesterase I